MSFAIFAVARRARRRRCPDFPHSGDIRQQLLHALTTLNGLRPSRRHVGPIHLEHCILINSSGLIFKRFDRCPMFGTTLYCSLLPFHFRPARFFFSSNCAGLCSQGLAVSRILQWGCIVTESQLRTTPEQNTAAIRSLSQKYNALTFKKRWFSVSVNTYCNDVHRQKAPAPGSAAILASPPCRHDCASGEK
ncbi:hypothetical protein LJR029_005676 [Caballeronia sp. LjRoot29]|uniref:hypothetical protein n=1 Tax=Caballeronia sp. LjRoot29 TaxID=3342315 RepID=UPI003ECE0906